MEHMPDSVPLALGTRISARQRRASEGFVGAHVPALWPCEVRARVSFMPHDAQHFAVLVPVAADAELSLLTLFGGPR
jgi:hypothetical protein